MKFSSTGPVLSSCVPAAAPQQSWEGCHVGADEPLGLPAGFSPRLDQPLAWTGAQFKDEAEFTYQLTQAEVAEINSGLHAFKALELDGDQVNRDNFPLPNLGPKLLELGQVLYDGRGFCVIRGVHPQNYSVEDLAVVWLGIQAYIAEQRGRQDCKGNMLVHIVADNTSPAKLGHHRHSTSAITFHNEEAGDIVAWLTRSTAASGGRCIIASAYHIYNVIAAHRPDVIRTLAKADWPFSLLIMNFGRTPLLGNATHPRPDRLPKTNDRQREALDIIETIAQATQLEIKTQPGDMHFINNLAVLHRREGFVNGEEKQDKRHLVRMRLRNAHLGWDIPTELQREWYDAFEKDSAETWHLEPMPGDAFPLRKYTN